MYESRIGAGTNRLGCAEAIAGHLWLDLVSHKQSSISMLVQNACTNAHLLSDVIGFPSRVQISAFFLSHRYQA